MNIAEYLEQIQLQTNENICEAFENLYYKNEEILYHNPKYVFTEYNALDNMIEYSNMLYEHDMLLNKQYTSIMESFQEIHDMFDENDNVIYTESKKSSDVSLNYKAPTTSFGKNLLRKILNAIKKALRFIGNIFVSIIKKIKNIKGKNSVDHSCEKAKFKPEKIKDKYVIKKIEVADDKSGEVKTFNAKFIAKSLKIKIENGEYEIQPNDGINGELTHANKIKLFGKEIFFKNPQFGLAKWFIATNNLGIIAELIAAIEEMDTALKDKNVENVEKTFVTLEKIIKKITSVIQNINDKPFKLKIDDVMKYNTVIKSLSDTLDNMTKSFDSLNQDADQSIIECFNKNNVILTHISFFIEKSTVGMNTLGNELTEVYKVDARYKGACKDLEQLAIFVENMITDGVPSIYVGYNTWYVLDYDLDNRDVYSTSKKKPRMGQTRIAFFPTRESLSDEVVKVALNTAGARANRGEKKLYNTYKALAKKENATLQFSRKRTKDGYPQTLDEVLAKPIKDYNGYVSTYEKLNTNFAAGDLAFVANEMKKQIGPKGKFLIAHGLTQYAINDIHLNNIGASEDEKKWKIIDYYLY